MTDAEYIKRVNTKISAYFDEQIKLAPSSESKKLITRIKETTKYGKRFRPSLLYQVYSSYGGKTDIVNIGAALELLHQTLLIHDDLIDEDIVRHKRPNIIGLYINETKDKTLAYNQALIAGDLLHNFVSNMTVKKPVIAKLFNEAFINSIYGQQLDLANVDNKLAGISLTKLSHIYLLKTASYSSFLPIKVAAELLSLNKTESAKLDEFAKSLGILLQMNNDHVDYFSGDDLKDYVVGKITYPYILGTKLAVGSDLRYLETNFGNRNVSDNKVVDILLRFNVKEHSQETLNKYLAKTLATLDKLKISDRDKLKLVALIDGIRV